MVLAAAVRQEKETATISVAVGQKELQMLSATSMRSRKMLATADMRGVLFD
jgi:hypothetical protein